MAEIQEHDLQLSTLRSWTEGSVSIKDSVRPNEQGPKEVQVTLSKNPCIAHQLRLSVNTALRADCVQSGLKEARKTCLFFRKSNNAWEVLKTKKQEYGLFPYRPLIDVVTRWGSTFAMIQRYIKIRSFIDSSVSELYKKGVKFGQLTPGAVLSPAEIDTLSDFSDVLMDIQSATAALGAEKKPTLHLKMVVVAGVIARLREKKTTTPPGNAAHEFSSILLTDIEKRVTKMMQDCPILLHLCATASFLSPISMIMSHVLHLPVSTEDLNKSLQTVGIIAEKLIDGWGV